MEKSEEEGKREPNKSLNMPLGKEITTWCHEETRLLFSKEILSSEVSAAFKTYGSYIKSSCEKFRIYAFKFALLFSLNILKQILACSPTSHPPKAKG